MNPCELEQLCIVGQHDEIEQYLFRYDKSSYLAYYFACMHNKLSLAQWIYYEFSNEDVVLFEKGSMFFYIACLSGYFELAKWLYQLENPRYPYPFIIESKCIDPYYFERICLSGNIDFMEWALGHLNSPRTQCFTPAFHAVCLQGNVTMAMRLFLYFPHLQVSTSLFRECCDNDHMETASWLYQNFYVMKLTITECYEMCKKQCHRTLKWWVSLNENQSYYVDGLFQHICDQENTSMATAFLTLFPDFQVTENNKYFHSVIAQNNGIMAKWFAQQFPERYDVTLAPIVVRGFLTCRIVGYRIVAYRVKLLYVSDEEKTTNAEYCCVCYEHATVRTECRHYYCESCLSRWFAFKTTCPYCRANITTNVKLIPNCQNNN